jgi:hypothetical protein
MFAADHRCTPDFRSTEGRMYFRKYAKRDSNGQAFAARGSLLLGNAPHF